MKRCTRLSENFRILRDEKPTFTFLDKRTEVKCVGTGGEPLVIANIHLDGLTAWCRIRWLLPV